MTRARAEILELDDGEIVYPPDLRIRDAPFARAKNGSDALYHCQRCGAIWIAAESSRWYVEVDAWRCPEAVGGCGRAPGVVEISLKQLLPVVDAYRGGAPNGASSEGRKVVGTVERGIEGSSAVGTAAHRIDGNGP